MGGWYATAGNRGAGNIASWTDRPIMMTGDVNMSGSITSADETALANYVFKSQPPPCDGCTSSLASGC